MDTNTLKNIQAMVDHFGGPTATARALGVSQPTVSSWKSGAHGISAKWAFRIEAKTGGAFRALDLCRDLLPETAA